MFSFYIFHSFFINFLTAVLITQFLILIAPLLKTQNYNIINMGNNGLTIKDGLKEFSKGPLAIAIV